MIEFTRYLYLKKHVYTAFIAAVLTKNKDEALFWIFELYHSGYRSDAMSALWCTYYGFYASQNALLEAYMKKKLPKEPKYEEDIHFMITFVSNLMIRNYNIDVFLLSGVANKTEEDEDTKTATLMERLESRDYESLAYYMNTIYQDKKKLTSATKTLKEYFEKQVLKKVPAFTGKCDDVCDIVIILARIMSCFMQLDETDNKKKKNLYVSADENIAKNYETIEVSEEDPRPDKLFQKLVKYSPNNLELLSVFCPSQPEILPEYQSNWVKYGYQYTPIWKERIEAYGGVFNEEKDCIEWEDDEKEEDFYSQYGYDIDEQPVEVQNKNIPLYDKRMSLEEFYNKYRKNGLYVTCTEMLEALTD